MAILWLEERLFPHLLYPGKCGEFQWFVWLLEHQTYYPNERCFVRISFKTSLLMKTNTSSLACIAGIFFGCKKVSFWKNEWWKQSIQSTALQPLEKSSTSVIERPPKILLPTLTKTTPIEKTICKLTIIILFSTEFMVCIIYLFIFFIVFSLYYYYTCHHCIKNIILLLGASKKMFVYLAPRHPLIILHHFYVIFFPTAIIKCKILS